MQAARKSSVQVEFEGNTETRGFTWWPTIVALAISVIYFGVQSHGVLFLPTSLSLLVDDTVGIGIIALGAGLVLLVGEIDLSPAVVSFVCGNLMAILSVRNGVSAGPAILIALLVGLGLGTIHGLLVVVARLPSAYVTLMAAFLESVFIGLVQSSFLPQTAIRVFDQGILGIESNYLDLFGSGLHIPLSAVVLLVLVLLVWYVLRFTDLGRSVYAIGRDTTATRRAGTNAIRIGIFALAATLAAAGGILVVARDWSASILFDESQLLFILGAPVIGGISLFGGRGSIWGVLFGALVCSVVITGGGHSQSIISH